MHISLTPHLEKMVKEKVAFGSYNNASEVIREALRLMEQNDQMLDVKRQALRDAVLLGFDQAKRGEFSDRSVAEIIATANSSTVEENA
ncbi:MULTISPECIES: type II toxin-antitoxin system ParD family antitoxin [Spirulina sp. CCY15215]|uniref:type II toxin-antitoxin system ParD family antitoxin n=1 Tax=Spirulina sp. CCY15215 TaxID=2767591 RepID=UPI001950CCD2|nr:type II toxin-antitoxin system ParD family antitoxin [Spirulina major]